MWVLRVDNTKLSPKAYLHLAYRLPGPPGRKLSLGLVPGYPRPGFFCGLWGALRGEGVSKLLSVKWGNKSTNLSTANAKMPMELPHPVGPIYLGNRQIIATIIIALSISQPTGSRKELSGMIFFGLV